MADRKVQKDVLSKKLLMGVGEKKGRKLMMEGRRRRRRKEEKDGGRADTSSVVLQQWQQRQQWQQLRHPSAVSSQILDGLTVRTLPYL